MARRFPDDFYKLLYDQEIVYYEKKGIIHFSYREEQKISERSKRIYQSRGVVPVDIQAQGQGAIKEYVQNIVSKDIKEQKDKFEKHLDYAKNPNFPVETEIASVKLKGRIISATGGVLKVKLDEPASHEGFEQVYYGFASAMGGHYIFNKNEDTLSEDAIQTAKKLLIRIFKDIEYANEYKDSIDLVNKLNKKE